jgi:hypothetical protein
MLGHLWAAIYLGCQAEVYSSAAEMSKMGRRFQEK